MAENDSADKMNHEGGSSNDTPTIRKKWQRVLLSKEQVLKMEESFIENERLTTERILYMSNKMNIEKTQIQNWFRNKRLKLPTRYTDPTKHLSGRRVNCRTMIPPRRTVAVPNTWSTVYAADKQSLCKHCGYHADHTIPVLPKGGGWRNAVRNNMHGAGDGAIGLCMVRRAPVRDGTASSTAAVPRTAAVVSPTAATCTAAAVAADAAAGFESTLPMPPQPPTPPRCYGSRNRSPDHGRALHTGRGGLSVDLLMAASVEYRKVVVERNAANVTVAVRGTTTRTTDSVISTAVRLPQ